MGIFRKTSNRVYLCIKTVVLFAIGLILCASVFLFFTLSIPVYIYRLVVILVAKLLRPDLGQIMGGMTAALANDYFSSKNPRAGVVFGVAFEGNMTVQEMKERIQKGWIDGQTSKKSQCLKFHQFPTRFMGFNFWKDGLSQFSVENHVSILSDVETPLTEPDIEAVFETLVNQPFPKDQSPWHVYVIENYQPDSSSKGPNQQVMIIHWHHLQADAMSMMNAILKAFCKDFAMEKSQLPKISFPQQTWLERVRYILTFPVCAVLEFTNVLLHSFVDHPLKIKDSEKEWNQLYVRSKAVPVPIIKDIKNRLQVSFTSVLLSAISKAISRHFEENNIKTSSDNMLFGAVLPMPTEGKHDRLTNHFTTVTINMNTGDFSDPFQRLKNMHNEMVSKRFSVLPIVSYYLTNLIGNHIYPVTELLFRNRFAPTALTNFALPRGDSGVQGKEILQSFSSAGAATGDLGILWIVLSQNNNVRFQACIEEGLMSREQAKRLMEHVEDEIMLMSKIIKEIDAESLVIF